MFHLFLSLNLLSEESKSNSCWMWARPGRNTRTAPSNSANCGDFSDTAQKHRHLTHEWILCAVWHKHEGGSYLCTRWGQPVSPCWSYWGSCTAAPAESCCWSGRVLDLGPSRRRSPSLSPPETDTSRVREQRQDTTTTWCITAAEGMLPGAVMSCHPSVWQRHWLLLLLRWFSGCTQSPSPGCILSALRCLLSGKPGGEATGAWKNSGSSATSTGFIKKNICDGTYLNGEGPARDGDDWAAVEVVGELVAVHRGAHEDQLQVWSPHDNVFKDG